MLTAFCSTNYFNSKPHKTRAEGRPERYPTDVQEQFDPPEESPPYSEAVVAPAPVFVSNYAKTGTRDASRDSSISPVSDKGQGHRHYSDPFRDSQYEYGPEK